MKYEKLPLTFEKQAEKLINRGLLVDKNTLINTLKNVNYYRLSGYLYPYRSSDDNFKPGTTFEKVWSHYTFDRHLRLLVMDAIERIEISIRTKLIYYIAHKTKAFGYFDLCCYPNKTAEEYANLTKIITGEVKRSSEIFVKHFFTKYGDMHKVLPIWMTGEIVSLGCTLNIYKGISNEIKRNVADNYIVPDEVLLSWLKTIHAIRNICAHHGRLWNRTLGVKPFIPKKKKYPEWHEPVLIPNDKIFGVLTIFKYLINIIAPQSKWKNRLMSLLIDYPEVSILDMGFPKNWKECVFWKD